MAALPRWLDDADLDREAARLAEPAVRRRVVAGLSPDLLRPHHVGPRAAPGLAAGPRAATWSRRPRLAGAPPAEVLVDLLLATGLAASAVVERPPATGPDADPARCCATRPTPAARTASSSAPTRTRAAGARSPGSSATTSASGATGPGREAVAAPRRAPGPAGSA